MLMYAPERAPEWDLPAWIVMSLDPNFWTIPADKPTITPRNAAAVLRHRGRFIRIARMLMESALGSLAGAETALTFLHTATSNPVSGSTPFQVARSLLNLMSSSAINHLAVRKLNYRPETTPAINKNDGNGKNPRERKRNIPCCTLGGTAFP
jgi:hypothetical protein